MSTVTKMYSRLISARSLAENPYPLQRKVSLLNANKGSSMSKTAKYLTTGQLKCLEHLDQLNCELLVKALLTILKIQHSISPSPHLHIPRVLLEFFA